MPNEIQPSKDRVSTYMSTQFYLIKKTKIFNNCFEVTVQNTVRTRGGDRPWEILFIVLRAVV